MSKFQIVKNVACKGQAKKKKLKNRKSVNYLAIPFKEMEPGDCIILKENGEYNLKSCVMKGVARALEILGLKQNAFKVDWTADKEKIGVWRVY